MLDVSNEFYCFFRRYFRNRSDFDPFVELVYDDQDMFVAARSSAKWPYSIEAPHSEGARRRDGVHDLSWQVLLFDKELASFASLHKFFSISYGRGPVESRLIRFADQIGGCCVAATFAAVDLS
jgi:hypothetical protein